MPHPNLFEYRYQWIDFLLFSGAKKVMEGEGEREDMKYLVQTVEAHCLKGLCSASGPDFKQILKERKIHLAQASNTWHMQLYSPYQTLNNFTPMVQILLQEEVTIAVTK